MCRSARTATILAVILLSDVDMRILEPIPMNITSGAGIQKLPEQISGFCDNQMAG